MSTLPAWADPKLWFTLEDDPNKRYYLDGNPHTFPGRMRGYDVESGRGFSVSKYEMAAFSVETEYWVKGFLSGNEPEPPRDSEGDQLPPDHPLNLQWERSAAHFAEQGAWVDPQPESSTPEQSNATIPRGHIDTNV